MLPITAVALVSTVLMLSGTPQEKPWQTQTLGVLRDSQGFSGVLKGSHGFGHYHSNVSANSLQRLTFKTERTIVLEKWQWLAL